MDVLIPSAGYEGLDMSLDCNLKKVSVFRKPVRSGFYHDLTSDEIRKPSSYENSWPTLIGPSQCFVGELACIGFIIGILEKREHSSCRFSHSSKHWAENSGSDFHLES